jgi:hypothetical protein
MRPPRNNAFRQLVTSANSQIDLRSGTFSRRSIPAKKIHVEILPRARKWEKLRSVAMAAMAGNCDYYSAVSRHDFLRVSV